MAATDKDPSAAIQLVEQTVNTFNQILVGTEGQFVPVPGHPDQPTLAERVKQNLSPSTVEAKAAAEAAKNYRDQAAQISGLSTVADAIGLALVPHPDVWSPLVDSLRLITGKGRDIKVGEDVVARTWQFERLSTATERQKDGKLRLVPTGEPRYEGGALVKERGTTNLYFPHDGSGSSATRGTVEVTAGSGLLGEAVTTKFREDMDVGGHYLNLRSIAGLTAGDDVSITVEFVPLRVGMDSIRLGSNDMAVTGTTVSITPDQIGKPLQITHRSTTVGSTLRSFLWGTVGGASQWQGNGSLNFEILSVQIEKGPLNRPQFPRHLTALK